MKSDLKISFHKKKKKQKKNILKSFPENLIRFFTPYPLRSTPGKSHAPRQVNLKLKLPLQPPDTSTKTLVSFPRFWAETR